MNDPTGNIPAPPASAPAPAALDPPYAEAALAKIRAAVHGNGAKAEDIRVENIAGEVFTFLALNALTLRMKTSEKVVPGQVKGPVKAGNPQALRDLVEKDKVSSLTTLDVTQKIRDAVLARADKGFGVSDETMGLAFLKREYVLYEPCASCRSQGRIHCQRCHGKGSEKCTRCEGQGLERCATCSGNGQVGAAQGGLKTCPACNGQRRTPCRLCQQKRVIRCSICKGKGDTTCKQCNGLAWNSKITVLETDASLAFDYDRQALPARVSAQIDALGKDIINHVALTATETDKQPLQDQVLVAYRAALPVADLTVSIKGIAEPFFVFGAKGIFIDPPDFLETLMQPGIEKLKKAARGEGDVTAQVQGAARYRTLRHVIIATSRFGAKKGLKAVMKNTPTGIGEEKVAALMENAAAVLKILTKKPRQISIALGIVLAAALIGGYFFSPAREMAAGLIADPRFKIAPDILVPILALVLSYLASRYYEKIARKTLLNRLLKK